MKHIASSLLVLCTLTALARPSVGAEMTGKEVFDHYCTYCHGSAEQPGSMQLARTRGTDKALLAKRVDLAPDYIEYIVRHGLKSMPPFVPSDLTDAKLKALVSFLTAPLPRDH